MQTIGELLSRDLTEPIEEVIKLGQQDEQTVQREITEYVATDRLKKQWLDILKKVADAPSEPGEGVGVWVSGFFGSGKSSFAKNLGYILGQRTVCGESASKLFIDQLRKQAPTDPVVARIADTIDFINKRVDTHVIMFDVQVDQAVRRSSEPIAEIMYTVLLRELGYAEDYLIADLEIDLEHDQRLGAFVRACAEMYRDQVQPVQQPFTVPITLPDVSVEDYAVWLRVRILSDKLQRASAILHRLDPATHPAPDSWARNLQGQGDVTIRTLVERTFELASRRRPGNTITFIIDEVGQYVARSVEKIENLRAVVEHFGQESKNRVLAHKAVAPVWIIITSQEKLDEVVAAIDDKRVELAKLQDRFPTHIDMAPADIREVATKRVLAKKPEAQEVLAELHRKHGAMLKTHTLLERTARHSEVSVQDFIQYYPYLPYFIDLSIDIVSGIRQEAGAPRHIGGSNRTIIKQTYEMLVSDRTHLADAPVGTLVTLDRIYDLVETNLSSEKQRDISEIGQRWPHDPWPARTAKAIALLEMVRDLPCSDANVAALLYDKLDGEAPLPHVQRAIQLLSDAQFIRQTESGWKLQTAQEKSWTAERNAFNPSPKERNDILEDRLRALFTEPALTRYNYHGLRTFRVVVSWEGRVITTGDAHIPLLLHVADGPEEIKETGDRVREDSRDATHRNELFWVMSLNDEIDEVVAEIYRSKRMVEKYNQIRAQNKINKDESSSLENEKNEEARRTERLRGLVDKALAIGTGFFRGVAKDGPSLGKSLTEILHKVFEVAVPDLYPKLEMGVRPLKSNEAEDVLKAANLTGLPKIFYAPPDGLGLVAPEGSKYVINLSAPIIKEVRSHLESEHSYGNKVTGRTMEAHFGGIGYGWEQEMLWLVLATLLRAGSIEVTYQGRRYRDHLDPQVRVPFSGTNAFRSASFAPRKAPDLRTLVDAAKSFENLTGDEVDVEESAMAQALQRWARDEMTQLLPVEAAVRANRIPLAPVLGEYHTSLDTILTSPSDDCVNMLAGEGKSLNELRARVVLIRKATSDKGLAHLRRMRTVGEQIWPLLHAEGQDGELADAAKRILGIVESGDYYKESLDTDKALKALETAYAQLYTERHKTRQQAFMQAIDDVKGQPNSTLLTPEMQDMLLKPLADRAGHDLDLPQGAIACKVCAASLSEMASDISAVDRLRSDALFRLQKLTEPEQKVAQVRISDIAGVGRSLSTEADVSALIEQLRGRLLELLATGAKIILE